jgi:hypothetical protein
VPEQVPAHWIDGAVAVASHSPVHCAEHEPVQVAWADTEPSQVALALHVPEHWPVTWPPIQVAGVIVGGVQLAAPLQLPSQLASALALTVH